MKEKIVLRSIDIQEITPSYIGWLNDDEIRRYLGVRHRKEPFTKNDMISFVQNCNETHRFHWGIFIEGVHIGNVSCSEWNNDNRWIDISYIIGEKQYWRRGIATSSVAAAINYLLTSKDYNKVQAHAVIENIASIKLMQKLGMKQDALLRENAYLPSEKRFVDEVIYSILKKEWNSENSYLINTDVFPMAWDTTSVK